MKKNNIIFLDVFNLLTKNDYRALMNTVKQIKKEYPNLTLINLTSNFSSITNWGEEVYSLTEKRHLRAMTPNAITKLNAKKISESLPASWNTFSYLKVDGGIQVGNVFWPLTKVPPSKTNKIFINPFLIQLTPPTTAIDENLLPMIIKTKSQNRFLDRHMILGVTKNGTKLIFYSENLLEANEERVIFLENKAVISL